MFRVLNTHPNSYLKNNNESKQLIARLSGFGEEVPDFKAETALFLVSIGNESFEEEKLVAQLKLIKNKFKYYVVLVGDKLQGFNIAAENSNNETFTLKQAEQQAIQNGDRWINKNYNYFETILGTNCYEIQRWDSWLNKPEFTHTSKQVEDFLNINGEYKKALQTSIKEYRERYKKKLGAEFFEKIQKNYDEYCKKYLLQESAVMILLAKNGYKYALYPAKQTAILEATFKLLIAPNCTNMFSWIPIRFKNLAVQDDINNLQINLAYKFFKSGTEKQVDVNNSYNIEIFAQIAYEQIEFFLKQIKNEDEQQLFLNNLTAKIFSNTNNLAHHSIHNDH